MGPPPTSLLPLSKRGITIAAFAAPVVLSLAVILLAGAVVLGREPAKVRRPPARRAEPQRSVTEVEPELDPVPVVQPPPVAPTSAEEEPAFTSPPKRGKGFSPPVDSEPNPVTSPVDEGPDAEAVDEPTADPRPPEEIAAAKKRQLDRFTKGPWPMGKMGAILLEKKKLREQAALENPESQLEEPGGQEPVAAGGALPGE